MSWQPGMTLEQVEKATILLAFRFYGGVQTTTAHALGISTRTLYNKLQSYGVKGLENGVESGTQGEGDGQHAMETETGSSLEPVTKVSTQQPVPVRKREEIQDVLPKQASGSNTGGRKRA